MTASRLERAEDVALLGVAASKLEKLSEGLGMVDGGLVWTVSRRVCRAYVWARYNGQDPVRAVAKRRFGTDDLEALGPGARADARQKVARLDACGVTIPRRSVFPGSRA